MTTLSPVRPNFYVVGAVKSGTTSLWAHLRKHPQVFLPKMKEPHFFADKLAPVPPSLADIHCPGDVARYNALYEDADKFVAIGDASPSYLWDESAPRNIYAACPKARIVIMLRDPVDRAYSHYLMNTSKGHENLPFLKALQADFAQEHGVWWASRLYVHLGRYADQVRRYLEVFGTEQVAVFLFNDLTRDPKGVFSAVARHIGVDPELLTGEELSQAENPYKMPRSLTLQKLLRSRTSRQLAQKVLPDSLQRWIRYNNLFFKTDKPPQDKESKKFLQQIYAPEIDALEELLQRKMPGLRQSWV